MVPFLPLAASLALLAGCGAGKPADDTGPPATQDGDGDGWDADEDCADDDATIHPDAEDVCDGIDNDCDGVVDEDGAATYWADDDADGFGDPAVTVEDCTRPEGYASNDDDCDDTRAEAFPGKPESCDGVDNDCDGVVDDDAADARTYWTDADGDGYGDTAAPIEACDPPEDASTNDDDCDDADASVHPGATEVCNDRDDDCDTRVDEGAKRTYYQDADGDGWGTDEVTRLACDLEEGWAVFNGDCDDADPGIRPDAAETCDGVDQDCDDEVDEEPVDGPTWYADADGDGYGDAGATTTSCDLPPEGYVADATDCDDADAGIHPDASEWCDGIDNDCDGEVDDDVVTGEWYADDDGDGYGNALDATTDCVAPDGYVADATDCDDEDAEVHPGADETCDGADDDCDGSVDEGFSSTCEDILCDDEGLIWEIPDDCLDDGGSSSGGDGLEVYCYWGLARFCLTGERCQWRDGAPSSDDGTTCEDSGLSTDYMANAWCEEYDGHTEYYCDDDEQIYFE